jgi:hypothetical protein
MVSMATTIDRPASAIDPFSHAFLPLRVVPV